MWTTPSFFGQSKSSDLHPGARQLEDRKSYFKLLNPNSFRADKFASGHFAYAAVPVSESDPLQKLEIRRKCRCEAAIFLNRYGFVGWL